MADTRDILGYRNFAGEPEYTGQDPTNWLRGQSLYEAMGYKFCQKVINTADTQEYSNFTKVDCSSGSYVPLASDAPLFDPDNPYHSYINTVDQDSIFQYGIQMRYYMVKPKEEQKYYSNLYGENPSREYYGATLETDGRFAYLTEQEPLVVYGIYQTQDLSQQLTAHGLDTTRGATIMFNLVYIRSILGRDPIIGDVIIPWDIPENGYEVAQVLPSNKTLYVPRRWKLVCNLAQWSK